MLKRVHFHLQLKDKGGGYVFAFVYVCMPKCLLAKYHMKCWRHFDKTFRVVIGCILLLLPVKHIKN